MPISNNMENNLYNDSSAVLWRHQVKKGVFHRHVISDEIITNNYGQLINYDDKGNVESNNKIEYADISNVIVLNQRRIGHSYYSGYGGGYYTHNFTGFSNSTSMTIGDIVFLNKANIPIITFRGIMSPSGIVGMVKGILRSQRHVTVGMQNLFN